MKQTRVMWGCRPLTPFIYYIIVPDHLLLLGNKYTVVGVSTTPHTAVVFH